MSDGKITFSTELDNKGLEKELESLKKKIRSLEDELETNQKSRAPLAEQYKKLTVELDIAKAKLHEMQTAAAGVFSKEQIAEQKENVGALQTRWDGVRKQVEKYDKQIQEVTSKLEKNKERAGEVAGQLAKTGPAARAMAKAMADAEKKAQRFSHRMKGLVQRALVFTMITQGLAFFRKWMGNVIKANDEAAAAVARLKGALLTLAQPLVDVLIPAFVSLVNILTDFINVFSRLVSFLFGTTIESSAEAAEKLNTETEALESVGSAAKKAEKALAGFDEINKLSSDSSSGGSSSSIAPDFSALKEGLTANLIFTLEDILFDWEGLTAENIMAKIVTGLTALGGTMIGFAVGGPGGAVLGILLGAAAGLAISNLQFNGDGKLGSEELLNSLTFVLGMLAGGVLGFVVGGPGGAAIGILLGAGASLTLSKLAFNNDGVLNEEEVLAAAAFALTTLAGGIIGFFVGGPAGAALGATIGAGVSLSLVGLLFDGDGKLNEKEILSCLATALGAVAGGVLGFVVGGPGGAAVGVSVGAGVTLKILDSLFEKGDTASVKKLIGTLVEGLVGIAGGVIGFVVGGPLGCAIGAAIGVGLSLIIDKAFFSDSASTQEIAYDEGEKIGDNVLQGANDSLGINSPSTEFAESGGYMMEGMANGIANKSALPVDAFKTVLAMMQSEFDIWSTSFLSGISDFGQEFAANWADLWKSANVQFVKGWNDILGNFQNGINNAISALNKLVTAANALSGVTGKSFSTAGHITVSKLPIPKLAQGAVIPPNREFLAVLGDQKSGTNIETPLSTMVEAFKNAMRSMNMGEGQSEANLIVDSEVLGKVIYRLYNKEDRRVGVKLTEKR